MPPRASSRDRKVAALSTALPAIVKSASGCAVKAAPSAPQGTRWTSCHTGSKDANGRLTAFKDAPSWFRPTLTPREMLLLGMHGGIYFNPKGGKPGVKFPRSKYPDGIPGVTINEFPVEWFEGVPRELYASRRYDCARNAYKVKSGLDQVGWETSGWINPCDPRGWTQWYFRFFSGRRLEGGEDERQMGRWNGVCGDKGRWKQNLIAKCLREGKAHDDASVSPVVRQTLLHWAYALSPADFAAGAKRVKTHGAAYVPTASLSGVLTGSKKRKAAASADDDEDDDQPQESRDKAKAADARAKRAQRRADAETKCDAEDDGRATTLAKRGRRDGTGDAPVKQES